MKGLLEWVRERRGCLGSRDRMWTIVRYKRSLSLSLSAGCLFHLHLCEPAQIHPPAYHPLRWLLWSLREDQICPARPQWPAPRLDPGVTLALERQNLWPSNCRSFVCLPHSWRHHRATQWIVHRDIPCQRRSQHSLFCYGTFYGKCYI